MGTSSFLSLKLVQCCLAIAFASNVSQLEMFTGACGIFSSQLHLLVVFSNLVGFGCALCLFSNVLFSSKEKEIMIGLAFVYGVSTVIFSGELSQSDFLLLELSIVCALRIDNSSVHRFWLARVLCGLVYTKLSACGDAWVSISSLKSSALNQPFPFTPVWHLAQIPDSVTLGLSMILAVSEILVPLFLVFTESDGPIMGSLGLAIYYALIGNANWTVLLLVSCAIRLLPGDICTLLVGSTTLKRWGLQGNNSCNEAEAESRLITGVFDWVKMSALICLLVVGLLAVEDQLQQLGPFVWSVCASMFGALLLFRTLFALRTSPKAAAILLFGLWFCGRSYLSLLSLGSISYEEDFSGLPTCATFAENKDLGHSRAGRSVYLFQTKFTQVGTNTVGRNLGGTRYAELSVPGSVHGDETRPPFLMGHFPRIALKLWRIGTGNPADVVEGIQLSRHLEKVIETGSEAMRVFFSSADDTVLASMIGSHNQVQAFAQRYEVTNRAADHQWWKRSQEHVAALPTKNMASPYSLVGECTVVIPPKLFGVPIETILLTGIAASLVLRILFSTGKAGSKKKKL